MRFGRSAVRGYRLATTTGASPIPPFPHLRRRRLGAGLADVAPEVLREPRPIRILPLGDSITHGYATPAGYRLRLAERLAADSWNVDFVGPLEHGPPGFAAAEHEGHGTFRIDRIRAGVPAWVAAAQPDVVLLMAGTNDLLGNFDPAGAPARLGD